MSHQYSLNGVFAAWTSPKKLRVTPYIFIPAIVDVFPGIALQHICCLFYLFVDWRLTVWLFGRAVRAWAQEMSGKTRRRITTTQFHPGYRRYDALATTRQDAFWVLLRWNSHLRFCFDLLHLLRMYDCFLTFLFRTFFWNISRSNDRLSIKSRNESEMIKSSDRSLRYS